MHFFNCFNLGICFNVVFAAVELFVLPLVNCTSFSKFFIFTIFVLSAGSQSEIANFGKRGNQNPLNIFFLSSIDYVRAGNQ